MKRSWFCMLAGLPSCMKLYLTYLNLVSLNPNLFACHARIRLRIELEMKDNKFITIVIIISI